MLKYRVALESWKSVCKLPYSKMKGRKVDVIVSSPRVKSVSVVDAQIIGAVWQSGFLFGLILWCPGSDSIINAAPPCGDLYERCLCISSVFGFPSFLPLVGLPPDWFCSGGTCFTSGDGR